MFTRRVKSSRVLFQSLLFTSDGKRFFIYASVLHLLRRKVKCCCYCLFGNWRLERQASYQMCCWLAGPCCTAALTVEAWHQVQYGSVARWGGIGVWPWNTVCAGMQLELQQHADDRKLLLYLTTHTQSCTGCNNACYFPVQWCVFAICACASCFSVAVYLILVFFSSVAGNLKPANGIFQSPLSNCSDTLMR